MPSKLYAYLLSAVMLAAVLRCAPGAPTGDAPADSLAGDTSGEEEETSPDILSDPDIWKSVKGALERHKTQLEEEFQSQVISYLSLNKYKTSSFPEILPKSNCSKELCLRRWAQGLLTYAALLKHVEKEYPNSQIVSEAKQYCSALIERIKRKMRNPDAVTALTSSEEQQLLNELDSPNLFHRRMTAHSILSHLYYFITDGKNAIAFKEHKGKRAQRSVAAVSYFYQALRRPK